jgi:zinc transporter 1/2/3
MTGLISMVAVFFVVVIEMIFSTMNGGSIGGCHGDPGGMYGNLAPGSPALGHGPRSSTSSVSSLVFQAQEDGGMAANGILRSTHRRRSASIGHQLRKIDNEDGFEVAGSPSSDRANEEPKRNNEDSAHSDDEDMELRNLNGRKRSLNQARMQMAAGGSMRLSDEQLQQKNLLQVMLLEAGILFHSVFIGIFEHYTYHHR